MIRKKRPQSLEQDSTSASAPKQPRLSEVEHATTSKSTSSVTEKMRNYKKNLKFNPKWTEDWPWIDYQPAHGMFCATCKTYGKPPSCARGAWVSKPINNWAKATELLRQHEGSDWHLASVEAQALASVACRTGDVVERLIAASEEEKRKNRAFLKKLVRSLYFLVKHRIAHTTTFEDLIQLIMSVSS